MQANSLASSDQSTQAHACVGLAFTWKHVLFELAPDTRYYTTFGALSGVDATFNAKVSYVF